MMNPTVLQRIAGGDASAVRDCIDQYGPLVWSIARRMSRNRADAEDAAQEIFLEIWRSAGRYDPTQGSAQVFIATIARRRAIDRLRKISAEPATEPADVLEQIAWPEAGSEPAAEIAAEAAQAARALAGLSADQRTVLELGLLHGLSQTQIAARLAMPLGSVKSLMRRGLIKIRERMGIGAAGAEAGS